jgi:hypothetical protein
MRHVAHVNDFLLVAEVGLSDFCTLNGMSRVNSTTFDNRVAGSCMTGETNFSCCQVEARMMPKAKLVMQHIDMY